MIFQFFIYIILSTSFKYILKTYSKASLIKQIFYLKFYNFGCRLEGVIFTLKIGFITIDIGDIGRGTRGVYCFWIYENSRTRTNKLLISVMINF